MPDALFVRGDSGENIRSGRACFTDKNREIVNAVFGEGPKEEAKLGAGVYKQYGKGKDGFNIISNQFSIHYFFENKTRLNGFLRNVSECCKVGGHFIGTSYDGTKVFRALENKTEGEGIRIMSGENKMLEITKQYSSDTFENNESCLGYRIDVYQESINKVFPEYLVNYDYFIELLEQYGFALLTSVECKEIGLTKSIGNFDLLFNEMQKMVKNRQIRKTDIGTATNMNPDEKKISFLNKYFIFKKIRDVNAEEIEKNQLNTTKSQVVLEEKEPKKIKKIKKMGKLKLLQVKKGSKLKKLKRIKLKKDPIKDPIKAP